MRTRCGDLDAGITVILQGSSPHQRGWRWTVQAGEENDAALRVAFDPRLRLEFHGSRVTSDAGLLPFRDLDDALGLTNLAGDVLGDTRTGQNSRHTLIAQFRQSVFGRLAGYEDVNEIGRASCRE